MIRGLLITTVVSFVVAVVCLAGAGMLGAPDWGGRSWSFDGYKKCTWSPDGRTKTCTGISTRLRSGEDDGPKGVRNYAWSGGDSLTVNAPGEIRYIQGPASTVKVTGPEALLQRLTFEDGEIDLTGRRSTRGRLVITVEAPTVTSFRFNGGQRINIDHYAQDSLQIEGNGAVDLHAEGTARKIELRMNGASHADLDDVVNDEAKVELNGASNASLSPKRSVDIRINGVGNVSLASNPPHMTKEIHGLGSVSVTTGGDGADTSPPPTAPAKARPIPRGVATDA